MIPEMKIRLVHSTTYRVHTLAETIFFPGGTSLLAFSYTQHIHVFYVPNRYPILFKSNRKVNYRINLCLESIYLWYLYKIFNAHGSRSIQVESRICAQRKQTFTGSPVGIKTFWIWIHASGWHAFSVVEFLHAKYT